MHTLRYWTARIGQSVLVLWAAFTLSFLILYALPSDPVSIMLGQNGSIATLDPEATAQMNAQYGFDQPLVIQYFHQLGNFLTGNFGTSVAHQQPVSELVAQVLPSTLKLSLTAFVLAMTFGLAIAVIASSTRNSWLRQTLQSLPPLALALPTFFVGLMLLQVFSFGFTWFPSFGDDGWKTLVLPAITLAIPVSAYVAQVLTKSFLTTWRQPFVQVAQAKGFGRGRLLSRHVFRNALIPGLTIAGIVFGAILAGTVITETVFSRPGLGRLTQEAVSQQDIPVVQVVVVLAAAVFVIVNLLVDALYPVIDPRIRRRAFAVS